MTNDSLSETVAKIKSGLSKGSCKQCVEKCKRGKRCQWFNPTVDFMEQVRKEATGQAEG